MTFRDSGPVAGSRDPFVAALPYVLDPFQLEAMDALDAGRSVLVTAPTGSGKTVVGEYAVHLALSRGMRAFYTTPIKALSNQKFGDLARRYGTKAVGLLTGDNSINAEAPVVVMTTEVLRNMIHAERAGLSSLGYVVLDEVHYLEDRYRGGVWEEVILGAPKETVLACLSATVANAGELVAWISTVRGETAVVVENRRPVELQNLFCIGERPGRHLRLLPTLVGGRPNPEAARLDAAIGRGRVPRRYHGRPDPGLGRPVEQSYRPRRSEVVEELASEDLLPSIYFVFSRSGCDEAVRHCLDDGLRLTSPEERGLIRETVESFVETLSDDELSVLNYGRFSAALEAGVAAHHAGMVPPFREAVESLFANGLVKVVFATETLAVGINMPARSVVIDELSKFSGEGHVELAPGEYTQLTGRAGRRGIDESGAGIVVASPFHTFADVARLVGAPGRPLGSSFRPTYNLAVSLVRRFDRTEAYRVVTSSFAQYLSPDDLGRELDAVIAVLRGRGYVRRWKVTAEGEMLAGLYHEADLLVADSLRAGTLDDLDPAELAAVVSAFCYEGRRRREGAAEPPTGLVAERIEAVSRLSRALSATEASRALTPTRGPDDGVAAATFEWARGRDLRAVLLRRRGAGAPNALPRARGRRRPPPRPRQGRSAVTAMTGGDFVRNMKQVVDLLRQLTIVAPSPSTRESAARAAGRLNRDVVAASSILTGAAGIPTAEAPAP